MPPSSEMSLKFHAVVKLGALLELLALAVQGTVSATKVSAPCASYIVEDDKNSASVKLVVKNSKQKTAEEFGSELMNVLCAVCWTGSIDIEGIGFARNLQIQKFCDWFQSQSVAGLSNFEPFDERSNLSLSDLENIFQTLALSKQTIESLLSDAKFAAIFPYADRIAGKYESLRHTSGCEIAIETRKDGAITSHRIDAPNPVRKFVEAWQDYTSAKPTAASTKSSANIFDLNGYRGSDESRWRISKLLGKVPPKHKEAVFAWAADAIHCVDEFHNTRGGVPLPEVFQYRVEDLHLTADRDLKFHQE